MNFRRLYSHLTYKSKGVLYDPSILLSNHYAAKDFARKMCRIKFADEQTGKIIISLTNSFHLKAYQVAQLHKHRRKSKLIFKWIKQHLKIKTFWGQSENAVRTKVWIAQSIYVLVAKAKNKFN